MSEPSFTVGSPSDELSRAVALAWRDDLLALGWPGVEEITLRLEKTELSLGATLADLRRSNRILGVWSAALDDYVFPDFQFIADRVHPRVAPLLHILAGSPDMTADVDRGGWQRAFWLYQPNLELSEQSLAAGHGRLGAKFDLMDSFHLRRLAAINDQARTPAEIFQLHPERVLAFALDTIFPME